MSPFQVYQCEHLNPKKINLISQKQCLQMKLFRLRYQASQNHQHVASFLWSLVKDIRREKKSNHFRYTSVVSTQIWQTHFWQTTPSQKIPNIYFVPSVFTNNNQKTYACCKTWLHLFVFCKFSTCYKWTKWAQWASILSGLSPLSPLKTK